MTRKRFKKRKSPKSERAPFDVALTAKDKARRTAQARQSRGRSSLIWWATGTVAVLSVLFYLLAIKPQRGQVKLPGSRTDNVLLITLDTTRADHLGCYGYPPARSPNLDRLAREGIRFSRVYCPAPLTLPSHASIMTGLYPVQHGVRNNGHTLPSGIKTLAEILKGHGYSTSAFVSSFSVDSRFGIDRGFDVYDDTFQSELPFKTQNAERRAEETFSRFSLWLESHKTTRFFCWVHYYDPHLPYDPPSPYKEEFNGRPYDGEIAYMDHYVGSIMDQLKEKGILKKTILVVAGDHGEGLGDKVEIGHGIFLYDETLRVPLIFHNAGVFSRPRVIESPVRLVDVAPTILETIGLKNETAGMPGQSLIPWISGKVQKDLDSVVETIYPRENFGWSELVGIVSGSWKFIQAPEPELYNLKNDPREEKNLAGVSAGQAAELKKRLERELLSVSSVDKAVGKKAGTRTEDLEKLRSLGYVNFAPARSGSALPDPKDRVDSLRLIQQAQAYEFEDDYPEAEQVYLRIMDDIPDSPASYINLAIAQARQKKFAQAIESLNKGLARIPDNEILLVRLGHTYLVSGKIQDALEAMTRALTLNPQNVDALTVCAGILDTMGQKEQAHSYYERALAVEPESRYLRMSCAGSLASSGKLKEAIDIYEKLIADFPEEQAFYQYIGIAYSYLGEYDRAIFYLNQAVAVGPTPVGFFNLAVAYEKSGNLQEAVRNFRRYLENPQGESETNIRKARAELERLEKQPASR